MKLKYILWLCCWLTVGVGTAQRDAARLYEKYAEREGVSCIYISEAMLELLPASEWSAGFDFANLQGKLKSLSILSAEEPDVVKDIRKDFRKLSTDKAYEELMRIQEDDTVTTIYARKKPDYKSPPDGKGAPVSELLVVVDEEDEFLIIRILGDFTLEDLRNLTNRTAEKKQSDD